MRKLLLFLISVGGITLNNFAQSFSKEEITNLKKLNLRGEIKYLELYKYRVKEHFDAVIKDSLINTEVYKFDVNGYVIYKKLSWGVEYKKSELCYINITNDNDSIEIFLNSEMSINKVYAYDSTGKLERIVMFKFDNNKNMIEKNTYKADGSRIYRRVYEYDIKNQLIKEKNYGEDGVLDNFKVYLYDAYGRCIKESRFNINGDLLEYTNFTFDFNNNLISEIYISLSNGYSSKDQYEYDELGNLKKHTHSREGISVINKKPWEYKSESTYSYEFDSNQNWVKRTRFYNEPNRIPEAKEIIERKINYL